MQKADWAVSEARRRMFADAIDIDLYRRERLIARIEELLKQVEVIDERVEYARRVLSDIDTARGDTHDDSVV